MTEQSEIDDADQIKGRENFQKTSQDWRFDEKIIHSKFWFIIKERFFELFFLFQQSDYCIKYNIFVSISYSSTIFLFSHFLSHSNDYDDFYCLIFFYSTLTNLLFYLCFVAKYCVRGQFRPPIIDTQQIQRAHTIPKSEILSLFHELITSLNCESTKIHFILH